MIDLQNIKPFVAMNPTSLTNGATGTSSVIDTQGYSNLQLLVLSSTADVVSDCPTVLKLQVANVTNASSFANQMPWVGGSALSTTVGFVIPNQPTTTNNQAYAMFNVADPGLYGRYWRALVSPQTTQTYTMLALLSRADQVPAGDYAAALQNISGIVVSG